MLNCEHVRCAWIELQRGQGPLVRPVGFGKDPCSAVPARVSKNVKLHDGGFGSS